MIKAPVMNDLARRFLENPLLTLSDVKPIGNGMNVVGLCDPVVFMFEKKIWLLILVAQRPDQIEDTATHIRFFHSNDGRTFYPTEGDDSLFSNSYLEDGGIQNCRVTEINGIYYLTFARMSSYGGSVGLIQTRDWKKFDQKGMILPPENRACTIFEEKIRDRYFALHAPGSPTTGRGALWIAESLDAIHWGNHQRLATIRTKMWDSARITAGGSPIETPQGWLAIYNGVNDSGRCSLGGLLLRSNEPWRVIARSDSPLVESAETYESRNSPGKGISTNGHLVVGDKLRLYYSANDEVICGVELSIHEILNSLSPVKD